MGKTRGLSCTQSSSLYPLNLELDLGLVVYLEVVETRLAKSRITSTS